MPSLGFSGFVLGIWAFGKVLLLGFRLNALGNWNGANFAPVSLLYFKSHVDRIKIPGGAASRSRMYSSIPNIQYWSVDLYSIVLGFLLDLVFIP